MENLGCHISTDMYMYNRFLISLGRFIYQGKQIPAIKQNCDGSHILKCLNVSIFMFFCVENIFSHYFESGILFNLHFLLIDPDASYLFIVIIRINLLTSEISPGPPPFVGILKGRFENGGLMVG